MKTPTTSQKIKALVLGNPGYKEKVLEDFSEVTLFASSFFDQPVPVRGVCFSAGGESPELARKFARSWLCLGTLSFHVSSLTLEPSAFTGVTQFENNRPPEKMRQL